MSTDGSNELLVRGPHRFLGYLDAQQTEAALVDGWFRTGDEAHWHGGRLRVLGRRADVASRNGRKISLAEVDRAFIAATGLTDCAAFVLPDRDTGERVAVAVRLDPGVALDVPAALAAMQRAGLAPYKLPESVVRQAGPLPMTSTGKVLRRELADAAGNSGAGSAEVIWRAERLGLGADLAPDASRVVRPTQDGGAP